MVGGLTHRSASTGTIAHTHTLSHTAVVYTKYMLLPKTYIIHRDIYVCTGYMYILGIYTHWGRDGPQHKSRITRTYVRTHLLGPTYLLVYVLVC